MRIGIITNYHLEEIGGAEEAIDRLATHWHRSGHDVTLFSSYPRRHGYQRVWRPVYRHVRIPTPFSSRYALWRYVPYLDREHRPRPFDIVLASDTYWAGHVARRFCLRRRIPYVAWSHGGDCMHGSRFLNRRVCRERMALAIRDAAGVVAVSGYVSGRLRELAMPRGLERIICNAWPDEWETAGAPEPLVDGQYVYGMGRLVRVKGFNVLLDAFAALRPKHPHLGLVIAGDGAERDVLFEQARSLGLAPRRGLGDGPRPEGGVYLPGFVVGEIKRALTHHATVGVCPSLWQDPQPLTVMEMLCRGLPVVASEVGGIPEIVQPGVNGDLFAPGDSAELARRIDRLLRSPQTLAEYGSQAAASVSHLRWSNVAHEYLQLFSEVVTAAATAPCEESG